MTFQSDGCTLFPDMKHKACCVAHDWADFTGTPDYIADIDLYNCVAGISGILIAIIMFIGLKIFRPMYRLYKDKILNKR